MNITDSRALLGKALGQIDELYFVDTMMRRIAVGESDEVPVGCSVVVRGWTLNPEPPRLADRLCFSMGQQTSDLWYGLERTDVGRAMNDPACAAAGFKQVLSLNGLQPGRHSLRITAIDEGHSGYYELDDERTIIVVESRRLFSGTSAVVGRMQFGIDRLERIGDIVVASGWVIDKEQGSTVSDVFGVVDDDQYTLAVSGMPRPEIAASLGLPAARACGFVLRIPTRGLSAGGHDLSLIAVARGGSDYEVIPLGSLDLR